jgi:hypothetical protein
MVYSNIAEGEKLTFKYYNSLDEEIINYDEVVDYTANANYGNDLSTYGLVREARTYEKPVSYGLVISKSIQPGNKFCAYP